MLPRAPAGFKGTGFALQHWCGLSLCRAVRITGGENVARRSETSKPAAAIDEAIYELCALPCYALPHAGRAGDNPVAGLLSQSQLPVRSEAEDQHREKRAGAHWADPRGAGGDSSANPAWIENENKWTAIANDSLSVVGGSVADARTLVQQARDAHIEHFGRWGVTNQHREDFLKMLAGIRVN